MRRKVLNGIPFSKKFLPLLPRLNRCARRRSVTINVQLREVRSPSKLIQHPGDLVLVGCLRCGSVRHYERRRQFRAKPGPENRNDQIVRPGVWNLFAVILIQVRVLILPKAGAEPRSAIVRPVCALHRNFIRSLNFSEPIGVVDSYGHSEFRGHRTNHSFCQAALLLDVLRGRDKDVNRSHL